MGQLALWPHCQTIVSSGSRSVPHNGPWRIRCFPRCNSLCKLCKHVGSSVRAHRRSASRWYHSPRQGGDLLLRGPPTTAAAAWRAGIGWLLHVTQAKRTVLRSCNRSNILSCVAGPVVDQVTLTSQRLKWKHDRSLPLLHVLASCFGWCRLAIDEVSDCLHLHFTDARREEAVNGGGAKSRGWIANQNREDVKRCRILFGNCPLFRGWHLAGTKVQIRGLAATFVLSV
jgi:hypothetical protein